MARGNETADEARAAVEYHKKTTSVDHDALMGKLYRIATGQPVNLDQGNDGSDDRFIDTSADKPDAPAEHINFEALMSGANLPVKRAIALPAKRPGVDFGDLTPLIKDIATFKFSSNRQGEIKAMQEAVQKEMRTIVAGRVAENTRQVSSEISQFFRIKEGGMRVEFSVLGRKYSMAALGQFRGDEYMAWNVAGNKVVGHLMRIAGDQTFENVSNEFEIIVSEGWKQ